MSKTSITCTPIGIIHSEHVCAQDTPIQPFYAQGCTGHAEMYPQFVEGLRDLEGFSHIYLIYHFHQAEPAQLAVTPFLQDTERGVFATRAPCRPNPIGLSIVQLVSINKNILHLDGLDILDGTPLLDIKPYTATFDRFDSVRSGWQDEVDDATARQRGRRGYRNGGAA
jgi:tRNA (adenine37-N6)-methyltransferase